MKRALRAYGTRSRIVVLRSTWINVLRLDQEATFQSEKFANLATAHSVTLQYYGVMAHKAVSAGERYHTQLRRVFNTIPSPHPDLSNLLTLRYALKGVKDTANVDEFVPSLLLFGFLRTYLLTNARLPGQSTRMKATIAARHEMARIITEQRINTALRSKLFPTTRYHIYPGDQVLVYREEKKLVRDSWALK